MPSLPSITNVHNGGDMLMESTDGKIVYYGKFGSGSGLRRAPASGGEEVQVLASVSNRGHRVSETGIYLRGPVG